MRHRHKDGPAKDKIPAHVLVRLPKEIRYRVNEIKDVINEMGYEWYCENAGHVVLRTETYYAFSPDNPGPDSGYGTYNTATPKSWIRSHAYNTCVK